MQIQKFEQKVWNTDGLRLVIKAPKEIEVKDYNWVNAANHDMTLTEYMNARIQPCILDLQATIVDGFGKIPKKNTKLGTLRQSYAHKN